MDTSGLSRRSVLLALAVIGAGRAVGQVTPTRLAVWVNGTPLAPAAVAALESAYRTRIVPKRYWYDRRSGLWGPQGGPATGQIAPGLELGGPLDPRASVGDLVGVTGIFINGREIHPVERDRLRQLLGSTQRGRYWLRADGTVGFEGGPPRFNLFAVARRRQGRSYTRRGQFGGTGSDGSCSYFMHPNGSSVMSGDC